MGFKFASFGAATMPLSKIIVDKDLDLRPHGVIARYCKAPVDPIVWPTETLDWGDVPASDPIPFSSDKPGLYTLPTTLTTFMTFEAPPGDSYTWRFKIVTSTLYEAAEFKITADGVELYHISGYGEGTLTVDIVIPAGSTVEIQGRNQSGGYAYYVRRGYSSVQNLGIVGGAKTFDLSGKWLALGIDMKGLAATIKIQGVEMPYEDYVKYFPIAPTELKIPGDWDQSQERPEIRVYK